MTIPVACGSCSKRFQANEKLAGKRVKCPKCDGVLTIPPIESVELKSTPAANVESEMGLETTTSTAPHATYKTVVEAELPRLCLSCAQPLDSKAILCVNCGYDTRVGKKLVTETDADGSSDKNNFGKKQPKSILAAASSTWHFLLGCVFSTIGKILAVYALIIVFAFSPLLLMMFAVVILHVLATVLNDPDLMMYLWFALIIGPLIYITIPIGVLFFFVYTVRLLGKLLDHCWESS
ncbi:MAG: hypothetical protein JXM70_20445 [Pirellulales bacterium]|nr:hypothetical protein [Pirellulales bacterium]